MNTVYIRCDSHGIIPDSIFRINGKFDVVLLDNDGAPIARYEFDCKTDEKIITYKSSNSKIKFSQTPKMTSEIVGSKCC